MLKTIRNLTLAAIIGLSIVGCDKTETKYHPEVRGNIADVTEYLKWRGQSPCEWLNDRDFDDDGVNDPYVKPKYNGKVLYHTKSTDAQPTTGQEIRWYLLRE